MAARVLHALLERPRRPAGRAVGWAGSGNQGSSSPAACSCVPARAQTLPCRSPCSFVAGFTFYGTQPESELGWWSAGDLCARHAGPGYKPGPVLAHPALAVPPILHSPCRRASCRGE